MLRSHMQSPWKSTAPCTHLQPHGHLKSLLSMKGMPFPERGTLRVFDIISPMHAQCTMCKACSPKTLHAAHGSYAHLNAASHAIVRQT